MNSTTLRHGCKINLFLRIGERLPDGYHELESLFLPLEQPSDRLEVRPLPDQYPANIRTRFLRADTPASPLPGIAPDNNSLTRAHAWYAQATGFSPRLDIRVFKSIPAGGGLGGGSANAATLLSYLQQQAPRAGFCPLDRDSLIAGSKALGADVPFFLLGGAAYATGIGEQLCPVKNPLAGACLLLVCPEISVSTAWAYKALDARREQAGRDGEEGSGNLFFLQEQCLTLKGHQARNSPLGALEGYGNDFEDLVFARYPELARLKESLLALGAETARMSGTGASLFAIFQQEDTARKAMKKLANKGFTVYRQRV